MMPCKLCYGVEKAETPAKYSEVITFIGINVLNDIYRTLVMTVNQLLKLLIIEFIFKQYLAAVPLSALVVVFFGLVAKSVVTLETYSAKTGA